MAQTITVNSRGTPSLYGLHKGKNDAVTVIYDFSLYFGSDTASALAIDADSGLTVVSSSLSANKATVKISGGSDGATYDLKVKATGATDTKEVTTQIRVADDTLCYTPDYGLYI